jgi:hypothetical protein
MDDYADWVAASVRQSNPDRAARQKAIEKRIKVPFRMGEEEPGVGRLRACKEIT